MAALLCGLVGSAAVAEQVCDTSTYPLSSPTARFEDHADGTITDTQTHLMWMRCSLGQAWSVQGCSGSAERVDWVASRDFARRVNRTGELFYSDWRVPQLRELATISERQCSNPRLNVAVFPNAPAEFYWSISSRPVAGADGSAFVLSFGADGISHRTKDETHHVRLVRTTR